MRDVTMTSSKRHAPGNERCDVIDHHDVVTFFTACAMTSLMQRQQTFHLETSMTMYPHWRVLIPRVKLASSAANSPSPYRGSNIRSGRACLRENPTARHPTKVAHHSFLPDRLVWPFLLSRRILLTMPSLIK